MAMTKADLKRVAKEHDRSCEEKGNDRFVYREWSGCELKKEWKGR